LFITFEGIDGCGKTTQAEFLAAELRRNGYPCLQTYQPGASSLGPPIRSLILNANTAPCALTEAMLFMADRGQHVHECLRPALLKGTIVLCDRYIDSTLAYQGYGSGQDIETLRQLNTIATAGLVPDLTFLFDIPPEKAAARRSAAGLQNDRFEREGFPFHGRVRAGYLALAQAEPARFVIIDAARAREEIFTEIRHITFARLEAKDV
jgi:dTMP kinase